MGMVSFCRFRRWFRLTPDRLVIVLLAVEGLLWLSERFGWFGFDEHKGWAVLIALASVGVAILSMLLWLAAALVFRVRFQFSLRSLLVLVFAVALPCSWLAVEIKAADRQREVVEGLKEVFVGYEGDDFSYFGGPRRRPRGPIWLRTLLGDHFFNDVCKADAGSDAQLEGLEGLTHLRKLSLDGSQVTDNGLQHLKGLTRLEYLSLRSTWVTDVGLRHVEGLTRLGFLDLGETRITDAGLKHLEGLTNLEELSLDDTYVTDAGLQHVEKLTNLQTLSLDCTGVTDAGLRHIEGLVRLVSLQLVLTSVSDAGLYHLERLTALEKLSLSGTRVTEQGVKKLQKALPNCVIDRWPAPVPPAPNTAG
jgi:hypothetical protein